MVSKCWRTGPCGRPRFYRHQNFVLVEEVQVERSQFRSEVSDAPIGCCYGIVTAPDVNYERA